MKEDLEKTNKLLALIAKINLIQVCKILERDSYLKLSKEFEEIFVNKPKEDVELGKD